MNGRMRVAAASLLALSLTLTACSGTSGQASTDDVKLTVWSWDGTVEAAVEGFQEEHPNITVDVVNAGSSYDEYKALDNAIQAGSGVPDIVMFEYFSIPYFAIPGKLTDLSEQAAGFKDDYVPAAWNNVSIDGGVYALPSDYGPAAMFYNQATFEKAGVTEAPTTWDEFYEAAKKIHALGDEYYITNDSADIFMLLSLIWQAGGRPFDVDGTNVSIDFEGAETTQAVEYWQKLLDEGLINTEIAGWSDEWNRALNDGTLATQITGGWLTSTLPERAPDAAGDFRVAPLPQWEEGPQVGAENGGSAMGIPEASQNKEAAFLFLEYFTHGDGVQTRVDEGAFVPNTKILESDEFRNQTNEYFGDQTYNAVLAQASENVATGWQYPPFFEWARTAYGDISADYYSTGNGSLAEILDEWKTQMTDYGNEQGFTVK
ncbi:ABC transporter substrate-binding protein [Paramicrobacterium fandaimingii]|uniref:ABC transporter substrate-binding protein n=1 Tax=Paramicrobacterium fandaimingii TaxID=2708079 RepID=UPI00141E3EA8|nr:sugar ABC transporter substrate-binding protein [Microbacterium fandaimingii]